MASIVKRKKKYSVVYTYTDEKMCIRDSIPPAKYSETREEVL